MGRLGPGGGSLCSSKGDAVEIRIENLASTGPVTPRGSQLSRATEGEGKGGAATPWAFTEHLLRASLTNYSQATVCLRKLRCREVMLPAPKPWERGQEEAPVQGSSELQEVGTRHFGPECWEPGTSTSLCRSLEGKHTSTTDKEECVSCCLGSLLSSERLILETDY